MFHICLRIWNVRLPYLDKCQVILYSPCSPFQCVVSTSSSQTYWYSVLRSLLILRISFSSDISLWTFIIWPTWLYFQLSVIWFNLIFKFTQSRISPLLIMCVIPCSFLHIHIRQVLQIFRTTRSASRKDRNPFKEFVKLFHNSFVLIFLFINRCVIV